MPGYGGYGQPGQVRGTGISIALFFCTFGIYGYVYNYQVHTEMKRYSGRGIGGGVALLLTFLAHVAMPFVTPSEVGSMYAMRGQQPPVRGWLGLWVLIPVVAGYFLFFFAIIASVTFFSSSGSNGNSTTAAGVGLIAAIAVYAICVIGGGVIWFVKTNSALNSFWESLYTS